MLKCLPSHPWEAPQTCVPSSLSILKAQHTFGIKQSSMVIYYTYRWIFHEVKFTALLFKQNCLQQFFFAEG